MNTTQTTTEITQFEELTRLTDKDLKWLMWWGCYHVISKTSGMEQEHLPKVQDSIIYFEDGRNSIHFETSDEALFEATRIINNIIHLQGQ